MFQEALEIIVLVAASIFLVVAVFEAIFIVRFILKGKNAEKKASKIIHDAEMKADRLVKNAQLDGKQIVYEMKQEADKEIRERKQEYASQENKLLQREASIDRRDGVLLQKEKVLEEKTISLELKILV